MENLLDAIARARAERRGNIGKLPSYEERRSIIEEDDGRIGHQKDGSVVSGKGSSFISKLQNVASVDVDKRMLERNRIIAKEVNDERVESYRQLRTRVLHAMQGNGWNSLAITSPKENAGKTLTAINLSIILSHEVGLSVLLVDLDLRQPSIGECFGREVREGVAEVLRGEIDAELVMFRPGEPDLFVLPGRAQNQYSSELLTSPGMRSLLDNLGSLEEQKLLVIFDLPPLLRNDDALKFAPLADATLLVVESGANSRSQVTDSLRMLDSANLIGTVLNKAG